MAVQYEKTVCYDINRLIEQVEQMEKDGTVDTLLMMKRLHDARLKAQRMENGLHARKEAMTVAGIEDKYQVDVKKKSTPDQLNNIAGLEYEGTLPPHLRPVFEFIIKEKGKVIYHYHGAKAGVLCVAERMDEIDPEGAVTGLSQKFTFGHPLAVWFAFDQLNQAIEAKKFEIGQAIKEAVMNNPLTPDHVKKYLRGLI
jgi:hypothetical protein